MEQHVRAFVDQAGLTERVTFLGPTCSRLITTWLGSILSRYTTVDDLMAAGGIAIQHESTDGVRDILYTFKERFEPKVCILWPFEASVVDMSFNDFVERYDDLWYPSSDDIWVLSIAKRRFLTINHEEIVWYDDLDSDKETTNRAQ